MSNIELKNNSHMKRKGKVPENQKMTSSVEVSKETIPLEELACKHFRQKILENRGKDEENYWKM